MASTTLRSCADCTIRPRTLCGQLQASTLEAVSHRHETHRLAAHEPLFTEGEVASGLYVVTAGALLAYKLLPDGRRQVLRLMLPGDVAGIDAADVHRVSAEALARAEVCRLSPVALERIAARHPDIDRELTRWTAAALEEAQLLGRLLRLPAEQRVAGLLLHLDTKARSVAAAGDLREVPLTREDLGDMVGLTMETTSRYLAAFDRRGLIRSGSGLPRLLRRDALRAIADGRETDTPASAA